MVGKAKQIFRYVDNYLVFIAKAEFSRTLDDVLRSFTEEGLGLRFTLATPKEYENNFFLDLLVDVKKEHVCSIHHPRTSKSLLNYRSAHSKHVKNGIVLSCFRSALTKACIQKMKVSFSAQITTLRDWNFPNTAIPSACDNLIRNINVDSTKEHKEKAKKGKKNVAVISYIFTASLMG